MLKFLRKTEYIDALDNFCHIAELETDYGLVWWDIYLTKKYEWCVNIYMHDNVLTYIRSSSYEEELLKELEAQILKELDEFYPLYYCSEPMKNYIRMVITPVSKAYYYKPLIEALDNGN